MTDNGERTTHEEGGARFSTDPAGRATRAGVAGVVSAGTLAVAFGLLALGVEWFWVAFPVGYGGILPLAVAWTQSRHTGTRDEGGEANEDHIERIRERYAAGELTDAEMEDRVAAAVAGREN